jgi:hypothetical protein
VTTDDQVLERLDHLIALLSLAFQESIDAARTRIRSDPVAAAILDAAQDDWIQARALGAAAVEQTGVGARTVARRIAELVGMGALAGRGATHSRAYRATGLV